MTDGPKDDLKPDNQSSGTGKVSEPPSNLREKRLAGLGQKLAGLMDHTIPAELLAEPEGARRGRLITRFAVLGSLFGFTYAAFYLLIGHKWGATIILICSLSVMVMPFLMRWKKTAEWADNL